jgi:hypothetical protein
LGVAPANNTGFFGGSVTLNDFLTRAFDDFRVENTTGMFRGYVGTGDRQGAMGNYRFGTFGDYLGGSVASFGVVKFPSFNTGDFPTVANDNGKFFVNMVGSFLEVDNLKTGGGTGAHVDLGVNLSQLGIPITVEVGSNAMFNGWANTMPLTSSGVPATSASSIAGAFRVQGAKVADLVSFDAIYRILGTDAGTRLENMNGIQDPMRSGLDRAGGWRHDLGAYAGVTLFNMLGIGAGYTASFYSIEQTRVGDETSATVEYVRPLFSGIDLRLRFTGVENLTVALNSNLSFAWQRGENDLETTTGGRFIQPMGWRLQGFGFLDPTYHISSTSGTTGIDSFQGYYGSSLKGATIATVSAVPAIEGNMWNTDQEDSWFALWNTLGVQYRITPKLTVNASVGNRLGVYDFIAVPKKEFAKWTTENFQAAVGASYAFTGNITFGAGLHLNIWSMQADITTSLLSGDDSPQLTVGKIGEVRFAIPIRFQVSF